ncbi:MAG: histidine phosphatase family protein [Bacteroidetes bacterium]|nr:histidine phosphatase family protein [Bacteroidota bacterium]
MKQLIIVRHAKSSWGNVELSDHDRPIKDIGVIKTDKVIKFLKDESVNPDLIMTSTAVRAYGTAKLIADGIGYNSENIEKRKTLYHAGEDDIYDELFSINNSINSVMLVAHNPTLTGFVNNFISPKIDNLPTTGVVCIEFKTHSWENIGDAKFKVKFVIFPQMLP